MASAGIGHAAPGITPTTIADALPKIKGEIARDDAVSANRGKSYLSLLWQVITADKILPEKDYGRVAFAFQALVTNVAFAAAKVVVSLGVFLIGFNFWAGRGSLRNRAISWVQNLARIAVTPITLPIQEITSIFGVFNPKKASALTEKIQAVDRMPGHYALTRIASRTIVVPHESSAKCEEAYKTLKGMVQFPTIKGYVGAGDTPETIFRTVFPRHTHARPEV